MPRNDVVSRSVYHLPKSNFAPDEKQKLNRAGGYTWCEDVMKIAYMQSHSQQSC
jgi:hypothetical protein